MTDHSSPGVRATGAFKPAGNIPRGQGGAEATFAARHFAVRRAGFLLRELARQQEAPADAELPEFATITSAEDFAEGMASGDAEMPLEVVSLAEMSGGISTDDHARLVAEAEERGRMTAANEFAAALDQAIAALDTAGRTLSQMQAEFERNMVVPLAQTSLHIASELARQALVDEQGMARYLESVSATLAESRSDDALSLITIRMNPEDVVLLDRSSRKPEYLRLVADAVVPRGGVIAASGDKVVDDRFENRFHEIREAVLAAMAELRREAHA
ncbi:MAG: hypothetical protein EBU76_09650 [Gammaproteobacteria bacterium]|nr:hypothetical protein [Gammaproteobacteria bacterium]NBP08714.1 hypothetical protein [Gammaproteobacteria bacterium]NBR18196.1 hypothetical protein [Gammaproteobacteria bacterium]NCW21279.1 hypothetical protein [Gammaproteobacteria bacterium]NDE87969.1 hypothetical protein [Gammaproteobacteria bacterium]